MSINVYCFENDKIAPLEIAKDEKDTHVDLLYYKNHYCWIKDLGKLVGSQVTKHKEKIQICKMCLNSFYSEAKLADHKMYCSQHESVRVRMPMPYDNIMQFEHYNHSLKVPFAVYTDFECMLQKIQTCRPSDELSYTSSYQKHTPTNFAYYITYANGDFKVPVKY